MRQRLRSLVVPILVGAGLALASQAGEPVDAWREKLQPTLRGALDRSPDAPVEFLVLLEDQADLASAVADLPPAERGAAAVRELRRVADATQRPVLDRLSELGLETRAFWVANVIYARGPTSSLAPLAQRSDVRRIEANTAIGLAPVPDEHAATGGHQAGSSVEWGVQMIRAPEVWALGYDGQGIVIGGQDTGYQWDHPALIDRYRGWDGQTATHDHNWHDSIHDAGGSCSPDSPVPCDDNGHGTHTMGTMVGDDGGANRIGVAPGSRWIACRNMKQGVGTPVTYTECFQWFLAPTDVGGGDPDPSRAPHVINNSWLCPPSEGCDFDSLQQVVQNVRAAGIVVVVSAGNSGNGCESISSPAAIYDASFTVGATNASDGIANFSSRGPVSVDGSGRLKPDVTAPGVNVRSSVPGNGYGTANGTSMAGPHVAGLVALLLDARPDLIGDVDAVETLITRAALPINGSQTCGGIPGQTFPNNVYGHGRIDALETLMGDGDDDGAANLTDCAPVDAGLWTGPGPVADLTLDRNGATQLSWGLPPEPGGDSPSYDVLRSESVDDFALGVCLQSSLTTPTASDTQDPAPGELVGYLIRVRNPCGVSTGTDSEGSPRSGPICVSGQ